MRPMMAAFTGLRSKTFSVWASVKLCARTALSAIGFYGNQDLIPNHMIVYLEEKEQTCGRRAELRDILDLKSALDHFKTIKTRQEASMIPSARPKVLLVAITIFTRNLFCFA